MNKRFLLQGETTQDIWLAIEFNAANVSIDLHTFPKGDEIKSQLNLWAKAEAELPTPIETITRGVRDENLLPEEIKVTNVGKVRQIEIEWANMLIQTRLLQSYDQELLLLKDRVAGLNSYSQGLFDECSAFWTKVLDFRKEQNISNEKMDSYKLELDVLFEAQKMLRKDSRKEFDEGSIQHFNMLTKRLDTLDEKLKGAVKFASVANELKSIRAEFNKKPMRKTHKQEVDTRINGMFDVLSEGKKKAQLGNVDKRISDLEGIMEKMQKGIDWENRQLKKLEQDKDFASLKFQVQLINTKIEMGKANLAEREKKMKNIKDTYEGLKKSI